MAIFVKELWAFGSKETAFSVDLLPFCAATSVESPLNQGTLYSTVNWGSFNPPQRQKPRRVPRKSAVVRRKERRVSWARRFRGR